MSIDETTKKIEEEQARKDTPKKQGVVKKIITYGLVLFSLGIYHPKNVEAADAKDKQKNESHFSYDRGNGLGITKSGKVGFSNGNVTVSEGKMYINVNPGQNDPEENKTTTPDYDTLIKKEYNLATPQRYIDEANQAYKNNEYSKIIDLSEEALSRIKEGKLRATPDEIKKIEHRKDVGYSNLK